MRTFEAFGAKRKLITTNKNIIKYDFYNSNNINLLNRINIALDKDFIDKNYIELTKEIYEKYSIKSWIYTIFDL
ncbi:hypothetical protein [Campylobacter geochelonis]|uniref:hypothetical protein n=1 Tax=Campylobacter geochelonis TaxID=1780362 RepID=UPI00155DA81D|nr:hypothetical protein [Campylobacter geochelonis]